MPNIQDIPPIPRRVLPIFFVLDTSERMKDRPVKSRNIDILNNLMDKNITRVKVLNQNNADFVFKVSILTFSTGCKWVYRNGDGSIETFIWKDLQPDGMCDFGVALTELNTVLSANNPNLKSPTGHYPPVIVFMVTGVASDNYHSAIEQIKQNQWFNNCAKLFIVFEDDSSVLSELRNEEDPVIRATQTNDDEIIEWCMKKIFGSDGCGKYLRSGEGIVWKYFYMSMKNTNCDDALSIVEIVDELQSHQGEIQI